MVHPMIERAEVAAFVALAEHGVPADVQELLAHGDGRGTVAPHAMRKAIRAVLTAMISHILSESGSR